MTPAERSALRKLAEAKLAELAASPPVFRLAPVVFDAAAILALLARLDTAERLLGEALRAVEDCASAAPHETITSIRTEDAYGKPVWLQAMAHDLYEPIRAFLAADGKDGAG